MSSSLDPFAQAFDSIPVGPQRAPEPAQQPGFYLLDDCNGRFEIDRALGIVSLTDESLLSIERGAVHPVRVRVVEPSGASYELNLRLRMTGRVPQIAGAEENDMLAGLASEPIPDLMSADEKAVQAEIAPEPKALPWTRFSAAHHAPGKRALYGETAPFGALFETPAHFPDVYVEHGVLGLDAAPPRAAANTAAWTL